MHEKTFADAFHVPQCSEFGLRLRNYAIGHELALMRDENPVVTYSEKAFSELPPAVQKLALAGAVEICAYRVPRFKLLWALRAARMAIEDELSKFRNYRAAGSLDLPTVKQPRVSGGPAYHYFGAPELARLLNYVTEHHSVMIQTHFDGSPLNFPLGLARILWMTEMETSGAIWVENWQDAESRRQREDFNKAHQETGFAVGPDAIKEAARKWNSEHPDTPVPED